MQHVFTYGSLMFDEVWHRVVAGRHRAMRGTVAGYERFEVRDETYPGMVAKEGASVDGVLHLDVDAEDLARLDAFEGDDYDRIAVPVLCEDGATRDAQTYLYRSHARLLASTWKPGSFAMERFLATYCRVPKA